MLTANIPLFAAANAATNEVSSAIQVVNVINLAAQFVFTGSPNGEIKLQASCDPSPEIAFSTPTLNWTDITGTATNVIAAGSVFYNVSNIGYTWIRAVWTVSSGTGLITARINTKGY